MNAILREFLFPILLFAFLLFNIFFAVTYINNPSRVITVETNLISDNGNGYLKKFHIIGTPETEYNIEVQPKTFWDYILLPKHHENLLNIFFQVLGSGLLIWYFLKTKPDTLFAKQNLRLLYGAFICLYFIALSISCAQTHAEAYWNNIYAYNANDFSRSYIIVDVNRQFLPICVMVFAMANPILRSFLKPKDQLKETV